MEYLKNPTGFLLDSGLLFEINRRVLHPLGLALALELPDDPKEALDPEAQVARIRILDNRDDPEGIVFEDDTFAEGQAKLERFVEENKVTAKLMSRRAQLGYLIQSIPPEPETPYPTVKG